jgi:hypothetical protein
MLWVLKNQIENDVSWIRRVYYTDRLSNSSAFSTNFPFFCKSTVILFEGGKCDNRIRVTTTSSKTFR